MLSIAQDYVNEYGEVACAIQAFVDDLMRGDPASFKSGYTLDNAVIAAAEAFEISREEVRYHVN